MVLGYLVSLVVAILVYLSLRRQRRTLRLLAAISLLLLGAAAATYLFLLGDEPPEGSIPVDQKILEREGVTAQEWHRYEEEKAAKNGEALKDE